jgi:hypothetical protein
MVEREYAVPRRCRHREFKMKITLTTSNCTGIERSANKE